MKAILNPEEINYLVCIPGWLPEHDSPTYLKITPSRVKVYCYINKIKYSISLQRPLNLFTDMSWYTVYILGDIYGRGN